MGGDRQETCWSFRPILGLDAKAQQILGLVAKALSRHACRLLACTLAHSAYDAHA